jgi:mobilization protein NikA
MAHNVQSKTKVASLKLTPEQHKLIDQRARQCGVRMSVWMRSILLQAARRQSHEGYLRIREPDGATI